MEIKCMIKRNTLLKGEATHVLYPKAIKYNTVKSADFVKQVARNRNLSEAQIKAALSAIADVMVENLSNGHSVQIDGIGTFSVSMKGEVKTDSKGVYQLKDARVNKVNFLPAKEMQNTMNKIKFTLINHEVYDAQAITVAEAEAIAKALVKENGQFLRKHFAEKAGVSYSYAGSLLKALVEAGKLSVSNLGRTQVYKA